MKSAFSLLVGCCLVLGLSACGDDVAIESSLVEQDQSTATDDIGLNDALDDVGLGSDAAAGTDVALWELPPLDIQGTDALVLDGDAYGVDGTDDAATDAGGDQAANCPGNFGCPCTQDADCPDVTVCAETANGKQCLAPCLSGTPCADGTNCVNIPGPDTLTTEDDKSVCAPQFPHLCDPCTKSDVCPSLGADKVACIGLGNAPTGTELDGASGWYCANFCGSDKDCPSDFTCVVSNTIEGDAASFCRPKSNVCTCSALANLNKAATTCASSKTAADGATITGCSGTRACGDTGLTACSAPVAVTEICDNVDNDCNGVTDDGMASGLGAMCDDKNPCTSDVCQGGACLATSITASCDDGDLCTVLDACSAGKCGGAAADCDDKNACTDDTCDSKLGCQHSNNTATCEDGDACTSGEVCKDGVCLAGTTNTCGCQADADCAQWEDGNKCNGTLYCAKSALPYVCKVNPLTTVTCDPSGDTLCRLNTCDKVDGACKFSPQNETIACDDGDVCTTGDVCTATVCTATGALPCDDSTPCTTDSCDPVLGCAHNANTSVCDDANACTEGDTCATGLCAGTPINCNDGSACTADSCDPVVLSCVNTNLDESVCQITSSYAEPFNCNSGALDKWTRSDALSPNVWVKWGFDATPAEPAPLSKACSLNINNGTDLACAEGQASVAATASSPSVDLSSMATGTATKLTFFSAGAWSATKSATVAVQLDGGGYTDLGTISGAAAWTKVSFSSTAWAGHKAQFRFSFAGTCEADANVGWFIDDFAVFEDLCVAQPGVCGANGLCDMDATGQLNCTTCPAGYAPQNGACVDVDECAAGTAGCALQATCANTAGSFTCTCAAGYTGDGKTCTDVDECATGKSDCAVNATCTNTDGSFTCACPAGLIGDGKTCGTLGSGPGAPAGSCLDIYKALPKSADGAYYLDIDGAGPIATAQYYCDMKNGGWTLLIYDTFDSAQGGWSAGTITGCGSFGNILGGPKQFGAGAAVQKTVNAPVHTQAKLSLNYQRIDSWDGENGIVYLDAGKVFDQAEPWASSWTSKCGGWWGDDVWNVAWTGAHSALTATVKATSTLDEAADNESFAIDNVILFVK